MVSARAWLTWANVRWLASNLAGSTTHVKFRHAAANQVDPGHAGDPQKTGVDVVSGGFPKLGYAPGFARQADAENRKGGKCQPVDLDRRRSAAACCESARVGRARIAPPRSCRSDQSKKTFTAAEPRPVVERMFVVPGMSFIASSTGRVTVAIISSPGHHAVVDEYHDARKIGLRKHRGRHRQAGVNAGETQCDHDEQNGLAVAQHDSRCAGFTGMFRT